jgi:hypothetical protein
VNEESRWEGAVLDSTIHAVSRGGDIEGLEGVSQGIGLDIKPYGLLGVNRDIGRADRVQPKREAGADIFYRLTPNLLSSTTINTDFAETEVDTRQVNLTRFPLLFPEKRAFFLEEAGVFQFGLPAAGNTMLPFFSRRIGLVGGETVPILFGEKLTGKIGRLEMGLLDVMTRDSDIAPGENSVVGRVKYGFRRQSYVGGIFTQGEPTGTTDNSLAGADILLATSNFLGKRKNFDVAAYAVKTNTPGIRSRDFSYGGQVRYPNDRWNVGYNWQEIGENFDPKLGYVRRRGVRINSLSSRFAPRPRGLLQHGLQDRGVKVRSLQPVGHAVPRRPTGALHRQPKHGAALPSVRNPYRDSDPRGTVFLCPSQLFHGGPHQQALHLQVQL